MNFEWVSYKFSSVLTVNLLSDSTGSLCPTRLPPVQMPITSSGCYLFFWLKKLWIEGFYWSFLGSNSSLEQRFPTFLALGTSFMKDNFSMDWIVAVLSRWFKPMPFTVHFISIFITSAPPRVIWHKIPEIEEPWTRLVYRTLETSLLINLLLYYKGYSRV